MHCYSFLRSFCCIFCSFLALNFVSLETNCQRLFTYLESLACSWTSQDRGKKCVCNKDRVRVRQKKESITEFKWREKVKQHKKEEEDGNTTSRNSESVSKWNYTVKCIEHMHGIYNWKCILVVHLLLCDEEWLFCLRIGKEEESSLHSPLPFKYYKDIHLIDCKNTRQVLDLKRTHYEERTTVCL